MASKYLGQRSSRGGDTINGETNQCNYKMLQIQGSKMS